MHFTFFNSACLLLALTCTSCSQSSSGHIPAGKCDAEATYNLHLSRFDETAQQLAHGTGCFIQTDLSRTGAVQVNPVEGTMTLREALGQAIKGTPLKIVAQTPDVITVEK
ncbi:hypothetical protein C7434_2014 [Pantoea sp. PNA 14-12]|uniref:STN domain-containing protein n=1 Tax=Pantoea TaxID=53335 RepID=UPI00054311CA|nr:MULTISPECIES: STN domain-containing protein [Pantoea]KHE01681.1 hypothetical protein NL54_10435 [Pantoea stewartii]KHN62809.1 hypothetical protein OI73_10175 [Pantoea stewartii]NRH23664.1 hypothetical protein [Pantoea stewartii]TDS70136.1 hypothetical protein C7434_2014 [Pantoea sp. PNA 14-12]